MNDSAKTIASRMRGCTGADAVAREALTILLEATGASGGHLFCMAKGRRLQLVASSEHLRDVQEVRGALEGFVQKELSSEALTTALEAVTVPPGGMRGVGERNFEPLILLGKYDGDAVIAGVAALYYPGAGRTTLRRSTLEALTHALITHELAEPVACVS